MMMLVIMKAFEGLQPEWESTRLGSLLEKGGLVLLGWGTETKPKVEMCRMR